MKEMIKIIENLSIRYDKWQVFNDFLLFSALTISNSVNYKQNRENEYLERVKHYKKEDMNEFPKLLALLVNELEKGPQDVLGQLFMQLELSSKWKGQFFTPYSLAKLTAELTITRDSVEKEIKNKGYITCNDCCSGGGVMLIAVAERLKELGFNPQSQLLAIGQDLDIKSVYMSYIQLSLLGIPAIIYHQNTLSLECWDCFKTPFFMFKQYKFMREVK